MSSGESTSTASGQGEETDEMVVSRLVQDVKSFMKELGEKPLPGFDKMNQLFKKILQREPLPFQIACWNTLSEEQRDSAVTGEAPTTSSDGVKQRVLLDLMKSCRANLKERKKRICSQIKEKLDHIIVHATPDAVFVMDSFLKLRNTKSPLYVPPERKSLDALSDTSEASAADLGTKLTAETIHHNMFTSGNLREQQFECFGFPEGFEEQISSDFGQVVQTLTTIRDFLNVARPRAMKPTTQALFSLFMEVFLNVFNATEGLKGDSCHAIAPVKDMLPLNAEVTISEQYMLQHTEMRELANKPTAPNYVSGDWETLLSVQSDLVVLPRSVVGGTGGVAKRQQQQFIQCDLNIEMKRFRLLLRDTGSKNKSPLTQVAAESYARKAHLSKSPHCIYSALTDCCGLYALCHMIKPDDESDEYWISRRETDPKRIVSVLHWLLSHSRKADSPDLKKWRVASAEELRGSDDAWGGGGEVASIESSGAVEPSKKRAKKSDRGSSLEGSGNRSRNKRDVGFNLADVLEKGEVVSDDDGSVDWSHFYALQNQRQTGPRFAFTGTIIPAPTRSHDV